MKPRRKDLSNVWAMTDRIRKRKPPLESVILNGSNLPEAAVRGIEGILHKGAQRSNGERMTITLQCSILYWALNDSCNELPCRMPTFFPNCSHLL
jgi:hypothetical protein